MLEEVDDLLDRSLEIFGRRRDDFALGRAWHCRTVRRKRLPISLVTTRTRSTGHASTTSGRVLPSAARSSCSRRRRIAAGRPPAEGSTRCTWTARTGRRALLAELHSSDACGARGDGHAHRSRRARTSRRRDSRDVSSPKAARSRRAGRRSPVRSSCSPEIPSGAEAILVPACEELRASGERDWLATNTAILSEALYRQGRFEDALTLSGEALELAPHGHLTSLAVARRVRAKALARAGELEDALALVAGVVDLLQGADVLDEQGEAFAALAEVHAIAGMTDEAEEAWVRRAPSSSRRATSSPWGGFIRRAPRSGSGGALSGSPHLRSTSRRADIRRAEPARSERCSRIPPSGTPRPSALPRAPRAL